MLGTFIGLVNGIAKLFGGQGPFFFNTNSVDTLKDVFVYSILTHLSPHSAPPLPPDRLQVMV